MAYFRNILEILNNVQSLDFQKPVHTEDSHCLDKYYNIRIHVNAC